MAMYLVNVAGLLISVSKDMWNRMWAALVKRIERDPDVVIHKLIDDVEQFVLFFNMRRLSPMAALKHRAWFEDVFELQFYCLELFTCVLEEVLREGGRP